MRDLGRGRHAQARTRRSTGSAAERIGVAPERCVFVDDLRENCEGAEAVGMTAIRHREPAETIARLLEMTGVELGG